MATTSHAVAPDQLETFRDRGYLVAKGLIPRPEVDALIETFMAIHRGGPVPPYFAPVPREESGGDILKEYPRIMHPHRFNEVGRRYLLDRRVAVILEDLFGEEPLAAQSMLYFKPPGARGQALHQDNFYLRVEPGTCIAAWMALDPADLDNGGLRVVPGSHRLDIACPEQADPKVSFTKDYVPLPPGLEAVPVPMEPGDVMFFNGSVIHGSPPNRSRDRFRRAFICHYIGRSSERMSAWYRPILSFDGEEVAIDANTGGGPCGTEEATGPH